MPGQEVGVVKTSPAELEEKNRPVQATPSADALERPDVSLQTSLSPRFTDGPVYASPVSASTNTNTTLTNNTLSPAGVSSSSNNDSSSGASQSSAASYAQKAYREARHFLGGLIQHPTESTKHYTILRHSHGIVFYQGSYTFLAISIFADAPLPADRTLWMQSKGWTGKTGMRARALLRLNDDWINVTPTTPIRPDQVKPSDERAWQRDIARFRKKGPQPMREGHQLRETAIVRIPVEAGDGYFQLVLCQGEKKKVLCYSPVFRVLSTSSDPSCLRGASLSTLPLELGAYIASTYATSTVQNLIAPVTQTVQNVLQPYLPSWKTQQALSTAYSVSGMEDRVGSTLEDANRRYDQFREQAFTRAGGDKEVDLEAGPAAPYPIDFVGRVEGPIQTEGFAPRMKVGGVPPHVLQRLYGYYFGWARLLPEQRGAAAAAQPGPWQQSIISATSAVAEAAATNVRSDQAFKTRVSIRFIDNDVEIQSRSRIEVRIMGFIRSPQASSASPSPSPSGSTTSLQRSVETGAGDDAAAAAEERMLLEACDASLAQSTLDHPAWAPDAPVTRKNENDKERDSESQNAGGGILDRTKERYAQALISGQRAVDRMPLHRLGVRMGTHELKDNKMVPVSGFFIPR